ncbi:MAG TPA: beta-mannosidase [Cellvibrio sp.]|nr:beta-mannosidase [Cellvibrio sp.]
MRNLTTLKKHLLKKTALALVASALIAPAFAGWTVNGTQVLDPNGNKFVFRGVNHAHTWFSDRLNQSLKDIAATGANSVRVVLSNGTQWTRNSGADVTNVINQCKANKLVCVLEVHDSTGYGESAAATHISRATEYWLSADIKAAITGQEDYVIVNIANEPFGNSTSAATYTADHITAVRALRNGGLTHMLMVDAANWGQDWQNIMRDNAASVLASDPQKNVMFSVHMYQVYNSASIINSYMSSFKNNGLALVVGEFAADHFGENVDESSIMSYAKQHNYGYLGWSWAGNGSGLTSLDIAQNFNASTLSSWGNTLINGSNGIKATSKVATIFGGGSSCSATTVTPYLRVNNGSWQQTASATVNSGARVEFGPHPTNGGSWSWSGCGTSGTNRAQNVTISSSCSATATYTNSCGTKSSRQFTISLNSATSSSSTASGGTCNWYGTSYPICLNTSSGWGWENNKSCIARSTCNSQ